MLQFLDLKKKPGIAHLQTNCIIDDTTPRLTCLCKPVWVVNPEELSKTEHEAKYHGGCSVMTLNYLK